MQRDQRLRVVFLDRDGVINRNKEGDYIKSAKEFEFLPGALEGLRLLHAAGWRVVVVSNQAGVGKGLMSDEDLREIDRLMVSEAGAAGGEITAVYYCTHRQEENCDCRKPAPGLILRASRDMGIDPRDTVFIGDADKDVMAGQAAGCRTGIVLSGRTTASQAAAIDPAPDFIAANLAEAARLIIGDGS